MMKEVKKNGNAISILSREDYLRKMAASNEPLEIRLTNNYAFKKVFKNKYILKGFLMALMDLKEYEIKDLEVIDPIEYGETKEEKEGILDIKVHMNNGKRINIEMQNRYQDDWSERTLFYNCRMFVEGYKHGIAYADMEPCIHVGILDFIQLKSPGFHHKIILMDEKTKEVYSRKFVFHVIELRKLDNTPKIDQNELYRWAKLLSAKSWDEINAEATGNSYMEEVKKEMEKISQDEMQRYLYLREAMALSDEESRMRTARNEGIRNLIESLQEFGIKKEDVLKKVNEKYPLPKEELEDLLKRYWK